jgi:hypothetical protein
MGTPMNAPGSPHRKVQKEDGEQYHEWRHGKNFACDPGLEIAANKELNEVQTTEYQDRVLPGLELNDGEQCRQNRSNERTNKSDVVEREGQHIAFPRKRESAE